MSEVWIFALAIKLKLQVEPAYLAIKSTKYGNANCKSSLALLISKQKYNFPALCIQHSTA